MMLKQQTFETCKHSHINSKGKKKLEKKKKLDNGNITVRANTD